MRAAELLGSLSLENMDPMLEITGLTADSREVKPGYVFGAFSGAQSDGAQYIPEACRRGARVVLLSSAVAAKCRKEYADREVLLLSDPNPRRRYAELVARFYGAQPEHIAAVTGTNGKTSVAEFCRQIWTLLGRRSASVGTLGVRGNQPEASPAREGHTHTTPPPEILHPVLARLAHAGVTHVSLEASSHGLAQYRLDGVRLAAAALTNITRDHLDYHEDAASYMYAKLRLFGEVLRPGGVAVLNREDASYSEAEAVSWARGHCIISVGGRYGDLRIVRSEPHGKGQRLRLAYGERQWEVALPLIGRFQAMNTLFAAALVIGCGEDPDDVFGVLPELQGVPGRMQVAGHTVPGATVLVDYAHTPEALRTVLEAVRPFCGGRLHVLFGCGGERDRGKRPLMGAVAQELADHVIVTDDNPRSEDPAEIRASILAACPRATEIAGRAEAIRAGVEGLAANDMLILAGKGHETGQEIAGTVYPFDDAVEVRRLLGKDAEGAGHGSG